MLRPLLTIAVLGSGLILHPHANAQTAPSETKPAGTTQATDPKTDPAPTSQTPKSPTEKTETVVTADTSEWLEVEPTGASIKFKMPAKPMYKERTFSPVNGQPSIKVQMHIGIFNSGAGSMVVTYHDLNTTPTTPAEINNTLNGAIIGSIANVEGKPVSQAVIRYRDNPGREFVYLYAQNNQIHQVSSRVFLVGNRQYQISVLMKQDGFDEAIAKAFLDTFRIIEPEVESESKPDSENKTEPSKAADIDKEVELNR